MQRARAANATPEPGDAADWSGRDARSEPRHPVWAAHIPEEEWAVYQSAIGVLRQTGRPFMLAGAFGLATYTGQWRNTKDLDFYILPQDRDLMVGALARAGFSDYFAQSEYQRHWIYRAWKDGCIVDIIWAMPNGRASVDAEWMARAPEVIVHDERLMVVPAEELLWCKLYVLQRDRCDWPDVLNLVHCAGAEVNWEHLIARLEGDLPLLVALLNVYFWLCPTADLRLPPVLHQHVQHLIELTGPREDQLHIGFLDTRPWFVGGRKET